MEKLGAASPPRPPPPTDDEEEQLHPALAAAEELRRVERDELVASYEALLAERDEAAQQHEAAASTLGPLQKEMRRREQEVRHLQASGALERQQQLTLAKVWRTSMADVEAALDAQVRQRSVLEADRNRFTEAYRKKLAQLQKEAEQRNIEVRRLAEKEENAMQAAAAAAGRQAERAFESKAREMKQRAEAAIQKERQQQSNLVTQLRNAADIEAAKLKVS